MAIEAKNDFAYATKGDSVLVMGEDGAGSIAHIISNDSILITCDNGGQYFASDGTSTMKDGTGISMPEPLDYINALAAVHAIQESAANISRIAERGATTEEIRQLIREHIKKIANQFDF